MVRGTLTDTYVAAIQHELVELPPDATRVGVVRRPTSWFHATVDENRPELGPPVDLLESMRDAEEDMKMQGLCEEGLTTPRGTRSGSVRRIASTSRPTTTREQRSQRWTTGWRPASRWR